MAASDVHLRQDAGDGASSVRLYPEGADAGGAPHQIEPVGFANAQTFGTVAVNGTIAPVGFENTATFGAPGVNSTIGPVGFVNSATFGEPSVWAQISAAGLDSAAAFGVPALHGNIAPAGFQNVTAFGTPGLHATIAPEGFQNVQSFGVPEVQALIAETPIIHEGAGGGGGTSLRLPKGKKKLHDEINQWFDNLQTQTGPGPTSLPLPPAAPAAADPKARGSVSDALKARASADIAALLDAERNAELRTLLAKTMDEDDAEAVLVMLELSD